MPIKSKPPGVNRGPGKVGWEFGLHFLKYQVRNSHAIASQDGSAKKLSKPLGIYYKLASLTEEEKSLDRIYEQLVGLFI